MQDGGQWMTVKEFATMKDISTQAVYKQLATGLQPYCKKENGRTFIHSDALGEQSLQPEFATNATKVCNQFATGLQPSAAEQAALDALHDLTSRQAEEIEAMRAQLAAVAADLTKAKQAAAVAAAERDAAQQRAEAAEKREQGAAVTAAAQLAALTEALQTAQQSQKELAAALTAAQALHAGTIRGQLDTAAEKQQDAQPVTVNSSTARQTPEQKRQPDRRQMPQKKKAGGFLRKLFRK